MLGGPFFHLARGFARSIEPGHVLSSLLVKSPQTLRSLLLYAAISKLSGDVPFLKGDQWTFQLFSELELFRHCLGGCLAPRILAQAALPDLSDRFMNALMGVTLAPSPDTPQATHEASLAPVLGPILRVYPRFGEGFLTVMERRFPLPDPAGLGWRVWLGNLATQILAAEDPEMAPGSRWALHALATRSLTVEGAADPALSAARVALVRATEALVTASLQDAAGDVPSPACATEALASLLQMPPGAAAEWIRQIEGHMAGPFGRRALPRDNPVAALVMLQRLGQQPAVSEDLMAPLLGTYYEMLLGGAGVRSALHPLLEAVLQAPALAVPADSELAALLAVLRFDRGHAEQALEWLRGPEADQLPEGAGHLRQTLSRVGRLMRVFQGLAQGRPLDWHGLAAQLLRHGGGLLGGSGDAEAFVMLLLGRQYLPAQGLGPLLDTLPALAPGHALTSGALLVRLHRAQVAILGWAQASHAPGYGDYCRCAEGFPGAALEQLVAGGLGEAGLLEPLLGWALSLFFVGAAAATEGGREAGPLLGCPTAIRALLRWVGSSLGKLGDDEGATKLRAFVRLAQLRLRIAGAIADRLGGAALQVLFAGLLHGPVDALEAWRAKGSRPGQPWSAAGLPLLGHIPARPWSSSPSPPGTSGGLPGSWPAVYNRRLLGDLCPPACPLPTAGLPALVAPPDLASLLHRAGLALLPLPAQAEGVLVAAAGRPVDPVQLQGMLDLHACQLEAFFRDLQSQSPIASLVALYNSLAPHLRAVPPPTPEAWRPVGLQLLGALWDLVLAPPPARPALRLPGLALLRPALAEPIGSPGSPLVGTLVALLCEQAAAGLLVSAECEPEHPPAGTPPGYLRAVGSYVAKLRAILRDQPSSGAAPEQQPQQSEATTATTGQALLESRSPTEMLERLVFEEHRFDAAEQFSGLLGLGGGAADIGARQDMGASLLRRILVDALPASARPSPAASPVAVAEGSGATAGSPARKRPVLATHSHPFDARPYRSRLANSILMLTRSCPAPSSFSLPFLQALDPSVVHYLARRFPMLTVLAAVQLRELLGIASRRAAPLPESNTEVKAPPPVATTPAADALIESALTASEAFPTLHRWVQLKSENGLVVAAALPPPPPTPSARILLPRSASAAGLAASPRARDPLRHLSPHPSSPLTRTLSHAALASPRLRHSVVVAAPSGQQTRLRVGGGLGRRHISRHALLAQALQGHPMFAAVDPQLGSSPSAPPPAPRYPRQRRSASPPGEDEAEPVEPPKAAAAPVSALAAASAAWQGRPILSAVPPPAEPAAAAGTTPQGLSGGLLLGSSAESFESVGSRGSAISGRYHHARRPSRAEGAPAPAAPGSPGRSNAMAVAGRESLAGTTPTGSLYASSLCVMGMGDILAGGLTSPPPLGASSSREAAASPAAGWGFAMGPPHSASAARLPPLQFDAAAQPQQPAFGASLLVSPAAPFLASSFVDRVTSVVVPSPRGVGTGSGGGIGLTRTPSTAGLLGTTPTWSARSLLGTTPGGGSGVPFGSTPLTIRAPLGQSFAPSSLMLGASYLGGPGPLAGSGSGLAHDEQQTFSFGTTATPSYSPLAALLATSATAPGPMVLPRNPSASALSPPPTSPLPMGLMRPPPPSCSPRLPRAALLPREQLPSPQAARRAGGSLPPLSPTPAARWQSASPGPSGSLSPTLPAQPLSPPGRVDGAATPASATSSMEELQEAAGADEAARAIMPAANTTASPAAAASPAGPAPWEDLLAVGMLHWGDPFAGLEDGPDAPAEGLAEAEGAAVGLSSPREELKVLLQAVMQQGWARRMAWEEKLRVYLERDPSLRNWETAIHAADSLCPDGAPDWLLEGQIEALEATRPAVPVSPLVDPWAPYGDSWRVILRLRDKEAAFGLVLRFYMNWREEHVRECLGQLRFHLPRGTAPWRACTRLLGDLLLYRRLSRLLTKHALAALAADPVAATRPRPSRRPPPAAPATRVAPPKPASPPDSPPVSLPAAAGPMSPLAPKPTLPQPSLPSEPLPVPTDAAPAPTAPAPALLGVSIVPPQPPAPPQQRPFSGSLLTRAMPTTGANLVSLSGPLTPTTITFQPPVPAPLPTPPTVMPAGSTSSFDPATTPEDAAVTAGPPPSFGRGAPRRPGEQAAPLPRRLSRALQPPPLQPLVGEASPLPVAPVAGPCRHCRVPDLRAAGSHPAAGLRAGPLGPLPGRRQGGDAPGGRDAPDEPQGDPAPEPTAEWLDEINVDWRHYHQAYAAGPERLAEELMGLREFGLAARVVTHWHLGAALEERLYGAWLRHCLRRKDMIGIVRLLSQLPRLVAMRLFADAIVEVRARPVPAPGPAPLRLAPLHHGEHPTVHPAATPPPPRQPGEAEGEADEDPAAAADQEEREQGHLLLRRLRMLERGTRCLMVLPAHTRDRLVGLAHDPLLVLESLCLNEETRRVQRLIGILLPAAQPAQTASPVAMRPQRPHPEPVPIPGHGVRPHPDPGPGPSPAGLVPEDEEAEEAREMERSERAEIETAVTRLLTAYAKKAIGLEEDGFMPASPRSPARNPTEPEAYLTFTGDLEQDRRIREGHRYAGANPTLAKFYLSLIPDKASIVETCCQLADRVRRAVLAADQPGGVARAMLRQRGLRLLHDLLSFASAHLASASSELADASSLTPSSHPVWAEWGLALLRLGHYVAAREKFAKCLTPVPRAAIPASTGGASPASLEAAGPRPSPTVSPAPAAVATGGAIMTAVKSTTVLPILSRPKAASRPASTASSSEPPSPNGRPRSRSISSQHSGATPAAAALGGPPTTTAPSVSMASGEGTLNWVQSLGLERLAEEMGGSGAAAQRSTEAVLARIVRVLTAETAVPPPEAMLKMLRDLNRHYTKHPPPDLPTLRALGRRNRVELSQLPLSAAPVELAWPQGTCWGGIESERLQQAVQLLSQYGALESQLAFMAYFGSVEQACQIMLRAGLPPSVFLQCIVTPCIDRGVVATELQPALVNIDPRLFSLRSHLEAMQGMLYKRRSFHMLMGLQVLTRDYVWAVHTCLRLFHTAASPFTATFTSPETALRDHLERVQLVRDALVRPQAPSHSAHDRKRSATIHRHHHPAPRHTRRFYRYLEAGLQYIHRVGAADEVARPSRAGPAPKGADSSGQELAQALSALTARGCLQALQRALRGQWELYEALKVTDGRARSLPPTISATTALPAPHMLRSFCWPPSLMPRAGLPTEVLAKVHAQPAVFPLPEAAPSPTARQEQRMQAAEWWTHLAASSSADVADGSRFASPGGSAQVGEGAVAAGVATKAMVMLIEATAACRDPLCCLHDKERAEVCAQWCFHMGAVPTGRHLLEELQLDPQVVYQMVLVRMVLDGRPPKLVEEALTKTLITHSGDLTQDQWDGLYLAMVQAYVVQNNVRVASKTYLPRIKNPYTRIEALAECRLFKEALQTAVQFHSPRLLALVKDLAQRAGEKHIVEKCQQTQL
ncbi:hypothetical protein PAPYR_4947 [Paratrimastix pyriformis]|uniref:ZFYVE26-like TPR repeats domain-containing protein n=1 Tax=Paratrimastix pyriformis TaxID=342808 RepID=A0ABQ8UIU8_9EUKA|nr:hypothetical protein PAPYR_4947 [Paratrimastix pyriformis]